MFTLQDKPIASRNLTGEVRFLSDFWQSALGMIGALVGTVLGWLLGRLDRFLGRITCTPIDWEIHFETLEAGGTRVPAGDKDAEYTLFGCTLRFHNSKAVTVGLTDFHWSFRSGRRELVRLDVDDDRTRRVSGGRQISADKLTAVNIPANEFLVIPVSGALAEDQRINLIAKAKTVWVVYRTHWGIRRSVKIASLE